jgi:hypothetical protein
MCKHPIFVTICCVGINVPEMIPSINNKYVLKGNCIEIVPFWYLSSFPLKYFTSVLSILVTLSKDSGQLHEVMSYKYTSVLWKRKHFQNFSQKNIYLHVANNPFSK